MGNYDITVIINCEKGIEELTETICSLQNQKDNFWEKTAVLALFTDTMEQENRKAQRTYLKNLKVAGEQVQMLEYNESIWNGYEDAIGKTTSPCLMLLNSGDTVAEDALRKACEGLVKYKEEADLAMMNCLNQGKKRGEGITSRTGSDGQKENCYCVSLNVLDDIGMVPGYWDALVWKTEAVRGMRFDQRHGAETKIELIYRILDKKRSICLVKDAVFLSASGSRESARGYENNLKPEYYLKDLDEHWKIMSEFYREKYQEVPLFIQCHLLYELLNRLNANKNQSDQHALKEDQLEQFWKLCQEWLQDIDDNLMVANTRVAKMPRHTYAMQYLLLNLKYNHQPDIEYVMTDLKALRKKLCAEMGKEVAENEPAYKYPIRIKIKGKEQPNILQPRLNIDLVNYENEKLIIDFSCPDFMKTSGIKWILLLNDKPVPYTDTVRYSSTKFFGIDMYDAYTFRIVIDKNELKKENVLQFTMDCHGIRCEYPVYTHRFTSRISSSLDNAYWCFGDYLMMFNVGTAKKKLYIRKRTPWMHLKRELKFLIEIGCGRTRRPKLLKSRLQYWLSYPKYHKKNIWITFDKIYKGGDCGEYFYKYCVSRKDTDVVPVYLMNEDAPDRRRLQSEGYEPLVYGTQKHRNIYLHAKMIFATHAGLYNFNGIAEDEIPYLQDLIEADAACIQHGLTVQDLAFNANRAFNNNKLYYCASKYEVQNLLQPKYGYDDPSAIKLTGIPRYDGLVNKDQKQILITPTWRSYIALPPDGKNNARPYSSVFKHTDYYKIYNNLISDQKLVETARKTGYKLIYLIHPAIAMQIEDFDVHDGVEIISSLGVNYEKILCESSLMLTDYSGVQFDFAYMRKPVVYYHPPKLPPHYVEGGFFYDTQGFGEICTEHQQLVDTLCDYMEHDCQLKDFYRTRQDDFFAFSDHDNCKRIFEDAYTWQKENR